MGEHRCPPGDPAWTTPNVIVSAVPLVVFPIVPVLIRHDRRARTLSSANLAMLYNPQQVFRRELRDPRGDRCLVVEVTSPVAERLLDDGRFTETAAPVPADVYLLRHELERAARRRDALATEELAHAVLQRTLVRRQARARRPRTREDHRELAEAAKDELQSNVAANIPLSDLAHRLAVSPFHLARVFREHTGFSLHEFRIQLRLRTALERLDDNAGTLTKLALELGFASHSHFTSQFRRAFGVPPSAFAN